jgi:hypothetical protein
MTPLRMAALVVLFTLAALSSVATFVESYRGEGLWALRAGHQFALEGDSPLPVLNWKAMFMSR